MKDKTTIVISVKPYKIGTGHPQRPGRAGFHKHRATKRNRTRGDQRRNAIREHS